MTADVIPFPKPGKRLRLSRGAWKKLRDRATASGRCVGCGFYFGPSSSALNAHHVYGRGLGGDDVLENLVPLCGSGTTGCHGCYENREDGWLDVAAEIRRWVGERHTHLLYLIAKLGGSDQARTFLDRYYPEHPTTDERGRNRPCCVNCKTNRPASRGSTTPSRRPTSSPSGGS